MTALVIVILAFFISSTINTVNDNITQFCFDRLVQTSHDLAKYLYDTVDMDRTILKAMSSIITSQDELTDGELCEIMTSYNASASYISYVELLRPDGTLLQSDKTVLDAGESLDFASEAEKGTYVSNICESVRDPNEFVIRNAVPVKRGSETVYMLYGVVKLQDFERKFITSIYDGHAYVHLLDGDTGDFILDTWHKQRGNINNFSQRQMVGNYDYNEAILDMKYGVGGNIAFYSKTTGDIMFMRYDPVGINNWSVIVTVEKQYAMRESRAVSSSLFWMAAFIGAVMIVYMICVTTSLLRAYRQVQKLGIYDHTTGLKNRNAYDKFIVDNRDKVFKSIICAFVDANGLHEINNELGHAVGDHMLRVIASSLKSEFGKGSLYRIGGDEFVVFSQDDDLETCREKMDRAITKIELHDYDASYGIIRLENERGVDRVAHEADKAMLERKHKFYAEHGLRSNR